MKKVITTVGTSIFSNCLEDDTCMGIKDDYESINEGISYGEYGEELDRINDDIKPKLLNFASNNNSSCAELTSIAKIKEKYTDIEVYLIATYTIESVVSCEIIKEVLEEKGITVYFDKEQDKEEDRDIIRDLQTTDAIKFNNGLKNLITRFKKIANNKYSDIVLNITGGYKAIIPYLTIMGELFDIPLHYVFEDSDALISIPKLPVGFDDKVADLYLPYLDKEGLKLLNSRDEIKTKLIDYGFIEVNKRISLTPLGELFKHYMAHKKTYLGIIIEFLIADLFISKNLIPKKGVTYPYTENNQEKTGEIDLIVEEDEAIEFFEIKSFGAYKEKQLKRHIEEYIVEYESDKDKILTILFYLLDQSLLNSKKQTFNNIKTIANAESNQIKFHVKYIIICPDKFQNFVRDFKDSEIQIFNYNT